MATTAKASESLLQELDDLMHDAADGGVVHQPAGVDGEHAAPSAHQASPASSPQQSPRSAEHRLSSGPPHKSSIGDSDAAARPAPASPPATRALRGVKMRFLPLSILYVYSGYPPLPPVGHSGGPLPLMMRSGALATWVLLQDQAGPASVVHCGAITTTVRRAGVQLADLRDNILVTSASSSSTGTGAARTLLDFLRTQAAATSKRSVGESRAEAPPTPVAQVTSQIAVRVTLTPLSAAQLRVLGSTRGASKLLTCFRAATGNDDEDALASARELLARGHDSLVTSSLMARLRFSASDAGADGLGASTARSVREASSPRAPARRDDSATETPGDAAALRRGSVSSETSDGAASLSRPGQKLSRTGLASGTPNRTAGSSQLFTPAKAQVAGVMRPSPADCAASPPRPAVFRYAPLTDAVFRSAAQANSAGSSTSATPVKPTVRADGVRSPSAQSVRSTGTNASAATVPGQASRLLSERRKAPSSTSTPSRGSSTTGSRAPSAPSSPSQDFFSSPSWQSASAADKLATLGIDPSAADASGARPGDVLMSVDGLAVAGCTAAQVQAYLASIALEEGAMLRVARPVAVSLPAPEELSSLPAAVAPTPGGVRVAGMRVLPDSGTRGRAMSAQPRLGATSTSSSRTGLPPGTRPAAAPPSAGAKPARTPYPRTPARPVSATPDQRRQGVAPLATGGSRAQPVARTTAMSSRIMGTSRVSTGGVAYSSAARNTARPRAVSAGASTRSVQYVPGVSKVPSTASRTSVGTAQSRLSTSSSRTPVPATRGRTLAAVRPTSAPRGAVTAGPTTLARGRSAASFTVATRGGAASTAQRPSGPARIVGTPVPQNNRRATSASAALRAPVASTLMPAARTSTGGVRTPVSATPSPVTLPTRPSGGRIIPTVRGGVPTTPTGAASASMGSAFTAPRGTGLLRSAVVPGPSVMPSTVARSNATISTAQPAFVSPYRSAAMNFTGGNPKQLSELVGVLAELDSALTENGVK